MKKLLFLLFFTCFYQIVHSMEMPNLFKGGVPLTAPSYLKRSEVKENVIASNVKSETLCFVKGGIPLTQPNYFKFSLKPKLPKEPWQYAWFRLLPTKWHAMREAYAWLCFDLNKTVLKEEDLKDHWANIALRHNNKGLLKTIFDCGYDNSNLLKCLLEKAIKEGNIKELKMLSGSITAYNTDAFRHVWNKIFNVHIQENKPLTTQQLKAMTFFVKHSEAENLLDSLAQEAYPLIAESQTTDFRNQTILQYLRKNNRDVQEDVLKVHPRTRIYFENPAKEKLKLINNIAKYFMRNGAYVIPKPTCDFTTSSTLRKWHFELRAEIEKRDIKNEQKSYSKFLSEIFSRKTRPQPFPLALANIIAEQAVDSWHFQDINISRSIDRRNALRAQAKNW